MRLAGLRSSKHDSPGWVIDPRPRLWSPCCMVRGPCTCSTKGPHTAFGIVTKWNSENAEEWHHNDTAEVWSDVQQGVEENEGRRYRFMTA